MAPRPRPGSAQPLCRVNGGPVVVEAGQFLINGWPVVICT